MLRDMGYPVVDADELARRVVRPDHRGHKQLWRLLGANFFDDNRQLRRRELAQYIFAHPEVRLQVENVLHPLIREEMKNEKERLEQQGSELAFYDVPLLFEKGLQSQFDATLLIYADETLQRERLKKRESWTDDEIDGRFSAQLPVEQKRAMADYVIENLGTIEDLRKSLVNMIQKMKSEIASKP